METSPPHCWYDRDAPTVSNSRKEAGNCGNSRLRRTSARKQQIHFASGRATTHNSARAVAPLRATQLLRHGFVLQNADDVFVWDYSTLPSSERVLQRLPSELIAGNPIRLRGESSRSSAIAADARDKSAGICGGHSVIP